MSRAPPLPPGLPPRSSDSYRPGPPRNEDYGRYENRDRDRDRDYDRPPMYHFGPNSDSYRRSPPRVNYGYDRYAPGTAPPPLRSSSNVYRPQYEPGPPSGDFTFRYDAPPTISAANADIYRPTSPQPRRPSPPPSRLNNYQQNNYGSRRGQGRGGGRDQARGGYRGRQGPRMASDRAFLKGNREPTPELMQGMDDEDGVRFKPVEDVSDSEEAEMDMSDDEMGADEKPNKRARTVKKGADGDSVPKWSNPDPYTALPPPDESQRKKKDVVKLIRKARVETSSTSVAKVDPTDDFISFDFHEDEDDQPDDLYRPNKRVSVVGAPTGPRFSHHENLHHQQASQQAHAQANKQTVPSKPYGQNGQNPVNDQDFGLEATHQNVQARANNRNVQVQVNNENLRLSKHVNIDTSSDPALGSRKRNIRDEIKDAPVLHKVGKGVSKKPVDGSVLKEWQEKNNSSGTPWLEIDHSDTANMGLWLHKEIVDFYFYVKPQDFESTIRTKLVEDLRSRLKRDHVYAKTEIHTFGSFPAGLYLPTADMDLVCVSDEFMRTGRKVFGNKKSDFHKFGSFIQRQRLAVDGSIEIIASARVPLVKYIDKLTGLKVDISFENSTGLVANQTFQDWKCQFPAMPILVTLIKHLLAMRGLNEPVNGGIGGFSVTCLVVSLLQNMPQVQSRTMVPEHHLGEVLMEFFDLYGNQFNTTTTAIQFNPPGYLSKAHAGIPYNAKSAHRLCIIDPNNAANDIAGGSGNTQTILKCFSQAYLDLQKRMGELHFIVPAARRNESILRCIIGGNYSSFKLQREHLAHVHEKLHGPVADQ